MNPPRHPKRAVATSAAAGAGSAHAATTPSRTPFTLTSPLWWLVRILSSVKVAMVLILVIALTVLTGTLIDQAPPTVIANPEAYQRWLANAEGTYGGATSLLDRFQLFNVFHSLFFRGLMTLLAVSIVVCTTKRFRPIWNTAFHTRSRMSESFLTHTRFNAQIEASMAPAEAAERLRRTLSHAHYRVHVDADGGSVALFGDKHRLSRFGTFFTHLSLILILAGAIAGGVWGFKDPSFVVAEGSTRALGLGTDMTVRLDRTVNDYYPDGRPKTLQSDLTLFENGKPVKQGAVLVNSPLRYKGVAFHESYFGQAAVMKVQDSSGKVVFSDAVPLALKGADGVRPVGKFEIPDLALTVLLVGTQLGAADALVPPGEIRVDVYEDSVRAVRPQNLVQGTPAELLEGLTFTFERENLFAGLSVVRDPGTTIIWIAGGLMILGMVMLFYLPPRRLWALCTERADGTTDVLLGMPTQRDVSLAGEFERLTKKVTKDLGADPGKQDHGGPDVQSL